MIRSYRNKMTEAVARGECPKGFPPDLVTVAVRKIAYLEQAVTLNDLRVPPKNCLEALKRDRLGQHSIRINKQWRICFIWTDTGPEKVEIVDYHD